MTTKIKLEIIFDQQTGQITVNGPIDNKILSYGMLELAKDTIKNFEAEQSKQILVARPIPSRLVG